MAAPSLSATIVTYRTPARVLEGALRSLAAVPFVLPTVGVALAFGALLNAFSMVSPVEFLFGLNWSPQIAMRPDQAGSSGAFGAIPLFWGTIFIGANIANVNTSGDKASLASYVENFSNIMQLASPSSATSTNSPSIGIGTGVALAGSCITARVAGLRTGRWSGSGVPMWKARKRAMSWALAHTSPEPGWSVR